MRDEMIDKATLNMLSSETLVKMKIHLQEETERVIKDIDSILNERGEK